MKNLKFTFLILFLIIFKSFGQRSRIPGKTSFGVKGYLINSISSSKTQSNNEIRNLNNINTGYGFSCYTKVQLKNKLCFQPEFIINSKIVNHFLTTNVKTLDLSLTQKGSIVNENEFMTSFNSISIPLSFKKTFELTPIRKGYSRYNQILGIFIGPRFDINFLRQITMINKETSTLYNQISRTSILTENQTGNEYIKAFNPGIFIGTDWESKKGLIFSIQIYRSIASILKPSTTVKSNINQISFGIGYKLY